jgi:large subunit ribosomal protein L10
MRRIGLKTRQLIIEEYLKRIRNSKILFITNFKGIDSKGMKELRQSLKKNSFSYFIVKNILFKRAVSEIGLNNFTDYIEGEVGIAYGEDNPILLSKTLVNFGKDYETFRVKAGYLEGRIIEEKTIKELASLQGQEALITQVVVGIKSPIVRFVKSLKGTIEKLVFVLKAIGEGKESNGEK